MTLYLVLIQNLSVMIQIYGWWVAPIPMKVEWNIAEECGGQFVMMTGTEMMLRLCADN